MIADQERISSVENLYRVVARRTAKQFARARSDDLSAEDLDLTLPDGSVFVAEIDQGVTGARAARPRRTRELPSGARHRKGPGEDFLRQRRARDAVRRGSSSGSTRPTSSELSTPAQLDAAARRSARLRRAAGGLPRGVARSRSPSTSAISAATPWSLLPGAGDFLAEIRTARYDTLTYARSSSRGRRHLVVRPQAPPQHRASTRRSEARERAAASTTKTTCVDYDVLDYDIDVAVTPDRGGSTARAACI